MWRVDKDEETAVFGQRTGESDANLYPLIGNSRVLHLNRILGPVAGTGSGRRGRVMRGWRDGMEVRVSVNSSLVVSFSADGTEFCVCVCVSMRKCTKSQV